MTLSHLFYSRRRFHRVNDGYESAVLEDRQGMPGNTRQWQVSSITLIEHDNVGIERRMLIKPTITSDLQAHRGSVPWGQVCGSAMGAPDPLAAGIRLRARLLIQASWTELPVAVDPIVGCLAGDTETIGELTDGIPAELNSPRGISCAVRSRYHLSRASAAPPVWRKCYPCPENMCRLCRENIRQPMSRFGSHRHLLAALVNPC